MIMATVLKMFRWLSISFGQGCSLQKPVLIFQIASSLFSGRADHVNPLKPQEMSPESGLWKACLPWLGDRLSELKTVGTRLWVQLEGDLGLTLAPSSRVPVDQSSSWSLHLLICKMGYIRLHREKASRASSQCVRLSKYLVNVNYCSLFRVDP